MEKISAVIITKDEERNIARCLESLKGVANEVVVVDSGSTDRTEAICREAGVRFVSHPWEGYSGQKNYANSLATHPWILSIDADEALSPTLRESLLALRGTDPGPGTVFVMNRLNNYCGHWIHHSGWYPDRKPRLFHHDMMEWDGTVHEELRPKNSQFSILNSQFLKGDLLHYTYYDVADHAARQIKYATLAAEKAFAQGKKAHRIDLWLKPAWTFLRNYLFRLGFLDGHAGFLVCRMSAFYAFLKYASLYAKHHS